MKPAHLLAVLVLVTSASCAVNRRSAEESLPYITADTESLGFDSPLHTASMGRLPRHITSEGPVVLLASDVHPTPGADDLSRQNFHTAEELDDLARAWLAANDVSFDFAGATVMIIALRSNTTMAAVTYANYSTLRYMSVEVGYDGRVVGWHRVRISHADFRGARPAGPPSITGGRLLRRADLKQPLDGIHGEQVWDGMVEIAGDVAQWARVEVTAKGNGFLLIGDTTLGRVYDDHSDGLTLQDYLADIELVDINGDGFRDVLITGVFELRGEKADDVLERMPLVRICIFDPDLNEFVITFDTTDAAERTRYENIDLFLERHRGATAE